VTEESVGILGLGETWRRSRAIEPPAAKSPAAPPAESERLPRRFGDFLLTSRVGTDALGHVYRGLTLGEAGEFVRVRLLDSPELGRDRLAETIRRVPPAPRRTTAQRPRGERLGVARGMPFLAWTEMHGWTLDALLRELRRRGRRLPVEHVLLVIDGLARALEAGGPHGLVWPGFVSITRDGEARLGGFGLAPAILPALGTGSLSSALSPYMAPETLEERTASADGDVYSLAAIALEALTDRPSPFPGLGRGAGADHLFPHELARLLRTATGRRRQRFATPGDFRRELGQFIVGSGHLPSSFHFSRFLRGLDAPRESPAGQRTAAPQAPQRETMPDVPVVPVLEEAEIESVLQKFWGQIDK
jgi:hypothetical protein